MARHPSLPLKIGKGVPIGHKRGQNRAKELEKVESERKYRKVSVNLIQCIDSKGKTGGKGKIGGKKK